MVIAADPVLDVVAALRARRLEQDRGNPSTRHRPDSGRNAQPRSPEDRRDAFPHISRGEVDHLEIALRSSRSVVEDGERSMLQWTRDFDYSANGSRNDDHRGRCAVHS